MNNRAKDNTNDVTVNNDVAPAAPAAPVVANSKSNSFRTAALIAVTAVMTHLAAGAFGWNWAIVAFVIVIFLGVSYFFTKYVGDDNEDNPTS